jgi:hypothetical protein
MWKNSPCSRCSTERNFSPEDEIAYIKADLEKRMREKDKAAGRKVVTR